MRELLPKDIEERITWDQRKDDSTFDRVKSIRPVEPCECGKTLDEIRRVRLARTVEPIPHWREYCSTCKLVSIWRENNWMSAKDLNAIMRKADFSRDK
jgi:hypothetical protein